MKLFFIALFIVSGIMAQENPSLTINISNISSTKGHLIIAVFKTDKNFLQKGSAFTNYSIVIEKDIESIKITDLPKGTYAVSLFHDENSDEECNRNFFGIPKEAFGFSNNVKPKLSAPSFNDCKFALTNDLVLDIALLNY